MKLEGIPRIQSCALAISICVAFGLGSIAAHGQAGASANDGPVYVAVASNFKDVQDELAKRFTAATGQKVETSPGSTGKLYAQITNGAPFHVFLSADAAHPERLENEGAGVEGTRFTYAVGRLAMVSAGKVDVSIGLDSLKDPRVTHIALANPETAPYGSAAVQVLKGAGLWELVEDKIVYGENIAQTHQFIESGAAEIGFVAYSQVLDMETGKVWLVSPGRYSSIRQDAILLKSGASHPGAKAYLEFMRSDEARGVIAASGYTVQP